MQLNETLNTNIIFEQTQTIRKNTTKTEINTYFNKAQEFQPQLRETQNSSYYKSPIFSIQMFKIFVKLKQGYDITEIQVQKIKTQSPYFP